MSISFKTGSDKQARLTGGHTTPKLVRALFLFAIADKDSMPLDLSYICKSLSGFSL